MKLKMNWRTIVSAGMIACTMIACNQDNNTLIRKPKTHWLKTTNPLWMKPKRCLRTTKTYLVVFQTYGNRAKWVPIAQI